MQMKALRSHTIFLDFSDKRKQKENLNDLEYIL
jgi:hypothetical protein